MENYFLGVVEVNFIIEDSEELDLEKIIQSLL